jgi:hypothetical protein
MPVAREEEKARSPDRVPSVLGPPASWLFQDLKWWSLRRVGHRLQAPAPDPTPDGWASRSASAACPDHLVRISQRQEMRMPVDLVILGEGHAAGLRVLATRQVGTPCRKQRCISARRLFTNSRCPLTGGQSRQPLEQGRFEGAGAIRRQLDSCRGRLHTHSESDSYRPVQGQRCRPLTSTTRVRSLMSAIHGIGSCGG